MRSLLKKYVLVCLCLPFTVMANTWTFENMTDIRLELDFKVGDSVHQVHLSPGEKCEVKNTKKNEVGFFRLKDYSRFGEFGASISQEGGDYKIYSLPKGRTDQSIVLAVTQDENNTIQETALYCFSNSVKELLLFTLLPGKSLFDSEESEEKKNDEG